MCARVGLKVLTVSKANRNNIHRGLLAGGLITGHDDDDAPTGRDR